MDGDERVDDGEGERAAAPLDGIRMPASNNTNKELLFIMVLLCICFEQNLCLSAGVIWEEESPQFNSVVLFGCGGGRR